MPVNRPAARSSPPRDALLADSCQETSCVDAERTESVAPCVVEQDERGIASRSDVAVDEAREIRVEKHVAREDDRLRRARQKCSGTQHATAGPQWLFLVGPSDAKSVGPVAFHRLANAAREEMKVDQDVLDAVSREETEEQTDHRATTNGEGGFRPKLRQGPQSGPEARCQDHRPHRVVLAPVRLARPVRPNGSSGWPPAGSRLCGDQPGFVVLGISASRPSRVSVSITELECPIARIRDRQKGRGLLDEPECPRALPEASPIPPVDRRMDDVGEILGDSEEGQCSESPFRLVRWGRIRPFWTDLVEETLDPRVRGIGLHVMEQADEVVFRWRQEGALDIDQDERAIALRRAGRATSEMQILGLEVPMGESHRSA